MQSYGDKQPVPTVFVFFALSYCDKPPNSATFL